MNTESYSSKGMSNVEKSLTHARPPSTIFEALYAVAHANGCGISLIDHRGRRFFQKFFVDDVPAVRRYGVWAVSGSVEACPMERKRARPKWKPRSIRVG
jgi:hypothetical protein